LPPHITDPLQKKLFDIIIRILIIINWWWYYNDILVIGLNKESQRVDEVDIIKIKNDYNEIKKIFSKLKGKYEIKVCYEAGPCGYTLYRQLKKIATALEVGVDDLIK